MRLTCLLGLVLVVGCGGADSTPDSMGTEGAPVTTGPVVANPVTTSPVETAPPTTSPTATSPITTTPIGAADCPEVLAVELTETALGVFTVSATVRSVDIAGVSYADAWEVRALDGTVLGTRILAHPHPNEQPFTRSLSAVEIPREITAVEVEARDSVRGFCGVGLTVEVPHS